jgi:hypothetical protein
MPRLKGAEGGHNSVVLPAAVTDIGLVPHISTPLDASPLRRGPWDSPSLRGVAQPREPPRGSAAHEPGKEAYISVLTIPSRHPRRPKSFC